MAWHSAFVSRGTETYWSVFGRDAGKRTLSSEHWKPYFKITCSRAQSSPSTDHGVLGARIFWGPVAGGEAGGLDIVIEYQCGLNFQENNVIIQSLGIVASLLVRNGSFNGHRLEYEQMKFFYILYPRVTHLGPTVGIPIQSACDNLLIAAFSACKAMPCAQNGILIQDGSSTKVTASAWPDRNLPRNWTCCFSSANNSFQRCWHPCWNGGCNLQMLKHLVTTSMSMTK